jgi:thiosulfate/3-mercaptopyruvate sulfurtransferase
MRSASSGVAATVAGMSPLAPLPPSAPLVSTQWLADHLGRDDLVVIDASVATITLPDGRPGVLSGHEEYILIGHVPGAVFGDLIDDLSIPDAPLRFTRPDPDEFAEAVGALGVDADTTVVVYDSALGQWAARLWWLLRAAGHQRAVVLDGGLAKWRAERRPVQTGHVEPAPAAFAAAPRPELWADKREVEAVVAGESRATLVCASPRREFTGEEAPRARAGHIPGSVSTPLRSLVDRDANTLLRGDALASVLAPVAEARGIGATTAAATATTTRTATSTTTTAPGRIIAYCGAGIAASAAALALTIAGESDVAVYDGSLAEWAADPEAPLAVA